jgi:hypothetical protein
MVADGIQVVGFMRKAKLVDVHVNEARVFDLLQVSDTLSSPLLTYADVC